MGSGSTTSTRFQTNRGRSIRSYGYPKADKGIVDWKQVPVGIVYHTTESHLRRLFWVRTVNWFVSEARCWSL